VIHRHTLSRAGTDGLRSRTFDPTVQSNAAGMLRPRGPRRTPAARPSRRRTAVVLAAFALAGGVAGPVAAADARMNPDPWPRVCAPGDVLSEPVTCP
jgi:hypothetical protein